MSAPVFGSLPIRTANPGDVVVYLASPSGTASLGTENNPLVVQNAAAGASEVQVTNTVGVTGAISLLGTSAVSGTIAIDQATPGANNVKITGVASVQLFDASSNPFGTSGNPIYVDVSNSVGTQAVSGSITIGTSLPSGANLIGSVDVANTVAVSGSVNIGGAGLGSSSSNPLYVSTGAGTSGALFNSGQLSTSVAGGSSATLATAPFSAGVAASLVNLVVAGSAAARYDFQVVDNSGTPTTIFSMFTTASQPNAIFKPYVDGEIISAAADGTNAKYQVVVNNVDVVTTNFYAYMAWSQP